MKEILYLHGFASSPFGAKATALATALRPHEIALVRPDLNVPSFRHLDFERIVDVAADALRANDIRLIVGSSLGALVALTLSARGATQPLVLIAPALGVADRWREKTPPGDPITTFHHGEGADREIHRAFFEQMYDVRIDQHSPTPPVTVIMGRNDETVPFDLVRETWNRWKESGALHPDSRFVEVPDGDHGLTGSIPLIADEIVRRL